MSNVWIEYQGGVGNCYECGGMVDQSISINIRFRNNGTVITLCPICWEELQDVVEGKLILYEKENEMEEEGKGDEDDPRDVAYENTKEFHDGCEKALREYPKGHTEAVPIEEYLKDIKEELDS